LDPPEAQGIPPEYREGQSHPPWGWGGGHHKGGGGSEGTEEGSGSRGIRRAGIATVWIKMGCPAHELGGGGTKTLEQG
jgi:hypothetical protein